MLKSIAIERYEQQMLGKKTIKLKGDAAEKERAASDILRYIIEDLLLWDAAQAEEHMTACIIRKTGINHLYRYFHFPPDIDQDRDLDYLACLAFPSHQYSFRKQVMRMYNRILSGEIDRFPKKFFDGENGIEKCSILLGEFIAHNVVAYDMEDLYRQFADTAVMNNRMRDAKVYSAVRNLYPTPLDCLHNSLTDDEKDSFLYAYWQYMNIVGMVSRDVKKNMSVQQAAG